MKQKDLFGRLSEQPYPEGAGYKTDGTSRDAAATVDVKSLRAAVRKALEVYGPMTADECAEKMGRTILSIRPRFSELRLRGAIFDTHVKRLNTSGKRAVVWELFGRGSR